MHLLTRQDFLKSIDKALSKQYCVCGPCYFERRRASLSVPVAPLTDDQEPAKLLISSDPDDVEDICFGTNSLILKKCHGPVCMVSHIFTYIIMCLLACRSACTWCRCRQTLEVDVACLYLPSTSFLETGSLPEPTWLH